MTTAAANRMVDDARWERIAPLAGVLAVIGWVIGILLAAGVSDKEKGSELLAAYKEHDTRILLGGVIWLTATALFVWFLGTLRARLYAAEGGTGRLASLAFAGGIATAVCGALIPTGDMAGALSKDDIDASAAVALHNMGEAFFFAAEYLCPVLLVATALLALRTRVLPRWLAYASLLIALVLLIGPIGWVGLIFGVPLWVLVVSFLLWREPPVPVAAGA